ncbi:MAG: ElyC/SanA/YdcF family protein [Leptolyngbyaceae bacterium]|nr:ElyC/SanA/YdcF family protein [Leptolyngbyaceae bacterium]
MATKIRKSQLRRWAVVGLGGLVMWGAIALTQLYHHAQQPVDAILVLGGSIKRELHVAETVAQGNDLPILISQGAKPPCVRIIFDRIAAPLNQVWLETCADSTFDNYRYSLSVLQQWGSHHIQVVTSASHLPRAKWLGRIMLGSHGIWVDMDIVPEKGVPANVENPIKTGLDVGRSLLWAIASQLYNPACSQVFSLQSVNLAEWLDQDFTCEHQADIQLDDYQSD